MIGYISLGGIYIFQVLIMIDTCNTSKRPTAYIYTFVEFKIRFVLWRCGEATLCSPYKPCTAAERHLFLPHHHMHIMGYLPTYLPIVGFRHQMVTLLSSPPTCHAIHRIRIDHPPTACPSLLTLRIHVSTLPTSIPPPRPPQCGASRLGWDLATPNTYQHKQEI